MCSSICFEFGLSSRYASFTSSVRNIMSFMLRYCGSMEFFPQRQGLSSTASGSLIRDDAPMGFRLSLLDTVLAFQISAESFQVIVCAALNRRPRAPFYKSWEEASLLVQECIWHKVLEVVERVFLALEEHDRLQSSSYPVVGKRAQNFAKFINAAFIREGMAWQLNDGRVELRGDEGFELAVHTAALELAQDRRQTAAKELKKALFALSQRPNPECRDAVRFSLGAIECVSRDIAETSKGLGDLLKNPKECQKLQLPPPLDRALEKLWGYSSNEARHVEEGREPAFEEAELCVGIAAAMTTYLTRKHRQSQA